MFDFDPAHARAPKLFLDATTGQPLGGAPAHVAIAPARPDPGPRPTAPTPTADRRPPDGDRDARPAATPKPTPTPKPKVAVKLSCKTSGGGKRITVSCTGQRQGRDAKKTTLRFQILKGKKVLATASVTPQRRRRRSIIKAEKKLKAGRYTLRITITQTGRTPTLTRDDPPEVGAPRAAGRRSLPRRVRGRPARARGRRRPRRRARPTATKIAGTDLSAAGGRRRRGRRAARRQRPRRSCVPLPERRSTRPIARYRAYSARQAAAMAGARAGAAARAARRRPRGAPGAPGPAPTSATCGSARPTARSATSTRRSSPTASGSSAGSGPASRCAALRPAAARLARDVRQLRRTVAEGRDHAAGLRDPRARDPRGRPARHAQRRRRALQRRGRARHRRVAGGHRGRRRHAARRCSPRAARSRRSRPGCCGCAASWRRSGAPTAALAGARRAHARPSASASTAGSAPAWRSSPALPHALETHAPAHDPGAAAVKVDRRRFLTRSALALGAVAAGEPVAAPAAEAPARRGRAATALGERVPFDGPHQAGVLTEPRDAVVLAALDAIAPDRARLAARRCRRSAAGRASSRRASTLRDPRGRRAAAGLGRARHRDRARRADGDDRLRRLAVRRATGSTAPPKLERMTRVRRRPARPGAHPRRRDAR